MSNLLPAFTHAIESPSSQDLLEDRSEGSSLIKGFKLSNIAYSYNLVTDKATFYDAFGYRLNNAYNKFSPKIPIFHLSMHGDENCIVLTNGECIVWDELHSILSPINKIMNGNLTKSELGSRPSEVRLPSSDVYSSSHFVNRV